MLTKDEFDEAISLYSPMIFRIAFNYLKSVDDANDIVQDVLIRLFVSDKEFESKDHIKNWLVRVTINQCKKVFRTPWQRRENLEDYINTLFYEQPDYQGLYEAVMKLKQKYRIPLLLFYYEGYSTREIAELMNLAENTVSTRLRRGKNMLRDYLKEDL